MSTFAFDLRTEGIFGVPFVRFLVRIKRKIDNKIMAEAIDIRELNIRIEQQSQFVTNLVMGMNKVIVGQKHLVDCLLIGLLSDGHILLEGVPGLAKTLAIKTLSQLISAD